jgi:hypothetical protein
LALSCSLLTNNQINFVLHNDNVLKLHDFDGGQVLAGLRLRARLVTGDQKQSRVHDCGSGKHSCHQHVVARAINE